jgi:acyl-CoA oxidase
LVDLLCLLLLVFLLQVGRLLPDYSRQLVAVIGPQAQQLVNVFGIPDHLVAAPIAANWEGYNTVDNQGELVGPAFAAVS